MKVKAIKRSAPADEEKTESGKPEVKETVEAKAVESSEPKKEEAKEEAKEDKKEEKAASKAEPRSFETPQWLADKELPLAMSFLLLIFLVLRIIVDVQFMPMLFNVVIGAVIVALLVLSFRTLGRFKQNRMYLISVLAGILALVVSLQSAEILLLILFTGYFVCSLFFTSKTLKLQMTLLLILALTAIMFRVFPAFPDANPGGNLISFDDPYYHYKHTNTLYTTGDIPDTDYLIYPPEGRNAPHKFSYYFVAFLAQVTGNSLHDVIMLYPVIMAAIGAVFIFFFMKELTKDWKVGSIAGFFFATVPVLLTKSAAGAVEEDMMGMAVAMIAFYFLIKAIKTKETKNLLYSFLSAAFFLMLLVSWKGMTYLYPAPMLALGIYAFFGLLLNYDVFSTLKASLVIGPVVVLGNYFFVSPVLLNLPLLLPTLFAIYAALVCEGLRRRYGSDKRKNKRDLILLFPFPFLVFLPQFSKKEERSEGPGAIEELKKMDVDPFLSRNLLKIAGVLLVLMVVGMFAMGVEKILDLPTQTYEEFAGSSAHNYLVDKTIAEQKIVASGGLLDNIPDKLAKGYWRFGISEIFAIAAALLVPIYLVILYLTNQRERLPILILAYALTLLFFMVAMQFVWLEARLGFSQSIGFILLGSMMGIFLPSGKKELESWKIIFLLVILLIVPFSTFYPYSVAGNRGDSWRYTRSGSSVEQDWVEAAVWLGENVKGSDVGAMSDDEYVLTWWDYGHAITALSGRTVIADPLQAGEDYIMRIARFFYAFDTEDEAMEWLQEQPWNVDRDGNKNKVRYIILDHSLVNKASALAFLGTNYYEVPNGGTQTVTLSNGTAIVGEALSAEELPFNVSIESVTCEQGIPCVNPESGAGACCDEEFNWRVIPQNGGSAVLLREASTPVYGRYQIVMDGGVCKKNGRTPDGRCIDAYTTTFEPYMVIEDGERKWYTSAVYSGYSGLPFGDGIPYNAFVVLMEQNAGSVLRMLGVDNGEVVIEKDFRNFYDVELQTGSKLLDLWDAGVGAQLRGVYVHVPPKWENNMFTKLYLENAADLKYFELIDNEETREFYPAVKIFKVTYPEELADQPEPEPEPEPTEGMIKEGDTVRLHYVLKEEDGTVFQTTLEQDPIEFTVGSGTIFDNAVVGLKLGDTASISVDASSIIPPDQEDHPLEGQVVTFDLQVVGINDESLSDLPVEKEFDVYEPGLRDAYNITGTPTTVWNCKFKKAGSFATGELTGEFESGKEFDALTKLTCIFNEGVPEELCSSYGVTVDENGTIKTTGDKEFLLTLSKTPQESCKDGNKTLLQVFYQPVCEDCDIQKPIIEQLKAEFGDYLDVEYHCIGGTEQCLERSEEIRL